MLHMDNSHPANDNRKENGWHHAIAAREIFKAIQAGETPERLYCKLIDFMLALARAGLGWEGSAPLRRLDNLLCRHECGIQRLSGDRVAALLGEWLAERCLDLETRQPLTARAG